MKCSAAALLVYAKIVKHIYPKIDINKKQKKDSHRDCTIQKTLPSEHLSSLLVNL